MAPSSPLGAEIGGLRELLSAREVEIAELKAEIARRDTVARYNQALALAGAILADRPELLMQGGVLAAEMIARGVPHFEVRARMEEIGAAPCV